jgi:hypothetical protein
MSHLSTDRLTAIADETPTPDEATHLAGCWDCRAEVAAYRRLARMAAMTPVPNEPLTAWSQLGPQLRAAGLIVDATAPQAHAPATVPGGAAVVALPQRTPPAMRWAMRIAAGLALLVGGGAVGRVTAPTPGFDPTLVPAMNPVASYASPDDAVRALTVAQQQYQSAAAFLASQDTTSRFIGLNRDTYEARLAALDEIAALTRAALYRAPQDPMLNQYYLTTLGAREATLRELGASMPDSRRLERY